MSTKTADTTTPVSELTEAEKIKWNGFSNGLIWGIVVAGALSAGCFALYSSQQNEKLKDMPYQVDLYNNFKATAGQLTCNGDSKPYILAVKDVPDFPTFYNKTVGGNCIIVPR